MTNTPILLMLFNRYETTIKVFERVREMRPTKLFVAANGPRPDFPKDKESCAAVRAIFDKVDWPCEVRTSFQETNIGMQPHWIAALDWFFESVNSGIILEDDCVPSHSFFRFCGELLEKYKDEEKVMHICGSNFQFGRKKTEASYYFSKYSHIWGWATWKRAWQKYDRKLSSFPDFKKNNLIDTAVDGGKEKKYWMRFFEDIYSGRRDGSDVKWLYSIWANRGVCIAPAVNMVTNIGYGPGASHTIIKDRTLGQKSFEMGKIIHPATLDFVCDREADAYDFKTCIYRSFFQKAFYKAVLAASKIFR